MLKVKVKIKVKVKVKINLLEPVAAIHRFSQVRDLQIMRHMRKYVIQENWVGSSRVTEKKV